MNSVWDSPQWLKNREAILRSRSYCEVCGSKDHLSIHHRQVFKTNMDRRIAFDREFDRFKRSYAGDPRHLRMKFITWLNRTGKMEIIRIERKNLTREEYLKMDDVIVVCRKCHYHYHSRRKF